MLTIFMGIDRVARGFVQEFVIGFGFLNGIWIHVGINPETEIIRAFSQVIQAISPSSGYSLLFWILPIILTISLIAGAYFNGGWPGLIAVALALLAGILLNPFGIFLLIIAIILGATSAFDLLVWVKLAGIIIAAVGIAYLLMTKEKYA